MGKLHDIEGFKVKFKNNILGNVWTQDEGNRII